MLKCTACIAHHDYDEKRQMVVPVLPTKGQRVTFGVDILSSESYVVKQIEYIIDPHSGATIAIHVHMEE